MGETSEDLGNGYRLRSLRGEDDARAFIALNQAVTGEGPMCDRLIHHRPGAAAWDFLLVEDARTGEPVSTTCLLAWELRYCGVPLRTTMVEMVVTHPAHRRQGLVRAQLMRCHRAMEELETDVAIIQGVPFYYRQFDYGYALDHGSHILLPTELIPETWRPAALEPVSDGDYPVLQALYEEAAQHWQLHASRALASWVYLHRHVDLKLALIRSEGRQGPRGYAACASTGTRLHVDEQVCADPATAQGFLAWARERRVGPVHIHASPHDPLWRVARSLGGTPELRAQWLLRLPDPARFLRKIAPVLEERLAGVGYSGLDTTLVLNLFRRAYRLRFSAGRLAEVEDAGFVNTSLDASNGGDLQIPPDAFLRLAMGYRGLDELRDAWPEVTVRPAARHLVEALFPRMSSFVSLPY